MAEWNFRLRAKLDDRGDVSKMVVEEPLEKDWAAWDAEHPYVPVGSRFEGGSSKTQLQGDVHTTGVSAEHGDYAIHAPESTGYHDGQTDMRIAATDKDGNEVGHLEYSKVNTGSDTELHIDHVESADSAKGSGLATGMATVMRANHPETDTVDPGMLTDDGAKWWNSKSMDGVRGSKPESADDRHAAEEQERRGTEIPGTGGIHTGDNYDYNALTPEQQKFVRENQ